MRLNPRKMKSVVVNRSRTYAPGYGDLTLGGAEHEKKMNLRILGVPFDSKLTFEIHFLKLYERQPKVWKSCA